MAEMTIPGGDTVTTHDAGVSEKKPREISGLDKAEKMKASPVFDVSEGSGEGRGAGMNGGAFGSGGSGGGGGMTSDPSNSTGTGIW